MNPVTEREAWSTGVVTKTRLVIAPLPRPIGAGARRVREERGSIELTEPAALVLMG